MRLRRGWDAASAAATSPRSTSACTYESSRVCCVSDAVAQAVGPRVAGVREQQRAACATTKSPVNVVAIPYSAGSRSTCARRSQFAVRTLSAR